MRKFEIKLLVDVIKEWANLEDFLYEIEFFNRANVGIIHVEVKDTKPIGREN